MTFTRLQRARSFVEDQERKLLRAYARYRNKNRTKKKTRDWEQERRLLGQKRREK